MPVPDARAPPQDVQVMCETRPVGSPPLKILAGRTCPKPSPWAKMPAGRPSVGTTGAAGLEVPAQPAHIIATAAADTSGNAARDRRAPPPAPAPCRRQRLLPHTGPAPFAVPRAACLRCGRPQRGSATSTPRAPAWLHRFVLRLLPGLLGRQPVVIL